MKIFGSKGFFRSGFLVVTILVILLIILVVLFSQQVLVNISQLETSANLVAIFIIILFPLLLLGIIILQLSSLFRDRAKRKPGVRLKAKLLLFFAFIALLSSVPLSVLSINFIQSTINFWLRAGIGDSLNSGLKIALTYYQGRVNELDSFTRSDVLDFLLKDFKRNPDLAWERIQSINRGISFIQLFDRNGREVYFMGNGEGRLADFDSIRGRTGVLPKIEREEVSILRSAYQHRIDGEYYTVIAGVILPRGFDENARNLTSSLESFNQLNRFNRLFKIVVALFYFFFTLPIFLLVILLSFLLSDELIRPIANLEEATKRIAEGDFSFRILARRGDELSLLVDSFNRMIGELESSREQILHAEKIAAWQEIAQRLAHEIRNPLTPIKLAAQRVLKRYGEDPESVVGIIEPSLKAVISEVDNLDNLLKEFREFARLPGPQPEKVDLRSVVEEVASIYRGVGKDSGRDIDIDISGVENNTLLMADPGQLKQVFNNLFDNAIHAIDGKGYISVKAAMVRKGRKDYWRIQIKDNGTGIDEELKEKIFDPYFTTKKSGTGLGLAIVERIVFDHNGNIWFESKKGYGTTFFIDLPIGEINE